MHKKFNIPLSFLCYHLGIISQILSLAYFHLYMYRPMTTTETTGNNSSSPLTGLKTPYIFAIVTLILISWGWLQREEYWIRAEEGIGYLFGIIGAVMMLLLLLYPLSKKARFMRNIVATRYWFKGHMILGIAGPLLILFHCNFGTGSTNSNVALFSMLLVVFSGLVGRYLFRQTHKGLYGKQLNYEELRNQHLIYKKNLQQSSLNTDQVCLLLDEIESISNDPDKSLIHSWKNILKVRKKSKQLYRQLKKLTKKITVQQRHPIIDLKTNVQAELQTLQSMAGLAFYNRLFSIWHVVHLPFFYMLIVTAIVHVVVVHMY